MNDPDVMRVGMIVANEVGVSDIANVLETEGMLEYMYSIIACGGKLDSVSSDLRIPADKLTLILKSSPQRRMRYMEARASELTDGAFDSLKAFKSVTSLGKEQKAAADHARQVIGMAGQLVSSDKEQESGPKVVVNSTVVIGENQRPPPLPAELEGIIDVSP